MDFSDPETAEFYCLRGPPHVMVGAGSNPDYSRCSLAWFLLGGVCSRVFILL